MTLRSSFQSGSVEKALGNKFWREVLIPLASEKVTAFSVLGSQLNLINHVASEIYCKIIVL